MKTPDAASGYSRPRSTTCVYCGKRISGRLEQSERDHSSNRSTEPERRRAARIACPVHRDLVQALDAYYGGVPSAREGMGSC
jgi:hypothetical protein